jgi:hypothetical protein
LIGNIREKLSESTKDLRFRAKKIDPSKSAMIINESHIVFKFLM